MQIVLRTCDKHGVHDGVFKSRIVDEPRQKIILKCIQSLILSANQCSVGITIMDDHSSDEFLTELDTLIKLSTNEVELIHLEKDGFNNSAFEQFNYANKIDDIIYFVEDDYFHSIDAISSMLSFYAYASNQFNSPIAIYPYDCTHRYWQLDPTRIVYFNNRYWRTITHTANTVMIHSSMVKQYFDTFSKLALEYPHVNEADTINLLYSNTVIEGGPIICFSPIPSVAYHMGYDNNDAPNVITNSFTNWRTEWDNTALIANNDDLLSLIARTTDPDVRFNALIQVIVNYYHAFDFDNALKYVAIAETIYNGEMVKHIKHMCHLLTWNDSIYNELLLEPLDSSIDWKLALYYLDHNDMSSYYRCIKGVISEELFDGYNNFWNGESSIILSTLRGIGDELFGMRYLPYFRDLGVSVKWYTHNAKIKTVVERLGYECIMSLSGETSPIMHCFNIPALFGDNAWSGPYIVPSAEAVDKFAGCSGGIGVVCSGGSVCINGKLRDIPHEVLVSQLPAGYTYYSLHIDGDVDGLISIDGISSIEDTLGVIANLDLIISVDTAVAHMTAAMNCPLIMLDPVRWFTWNTKRGENVWYGDNCHVLRYVVGQYDLSSLNELIPHVISKNSK